MRYRELFEQDGNKPFYHVTTKRRVKSIMQHGIVSAGHHRRWKNYVGGKLGNRGYIYLISDFAAAVKWAAKMDYDLNPRRSDGKRNQPIVVLRIQNIPTDQLESDPNIEGQFMSSGKWFQMKGAIAPENIDRIIPLTDDMIKQVVRLNQQTNDTIAEPAEPASRTPLPDQENRTII